MHKELLCNIAPYFDAALKGSFQEAQEQTIEMPDEDAEVFEYFQLWAYTDCVVTETETEKDVTPMLLIKLYVFAEARCIPRLQNAALDVLIVRMTTKIPVGHLKFVYANTAENSSLRRLFVDQMASTRVLHDGVFVGELNRSCYPVEFLFDLLIAQSKKLGGVRLNGAYFLQNRFDYHAKVLTSPPRGAKVDGGASGC